MEIRTLYLETQRMKKSITKIKLKLIIMEKTLIQLESIINKKRTIHGEPFINKVVKIIMNLSKKRISQRELLRKFTNKRLIDFLVIRDRLESKYNIKILLDSHQKIIYYYENSD